MHFCTFPRIFTFQKVQKRGGDWAFTSGGGFTPPQNLIRDPFGPSIVLAPETGSKSCTKSGPKGTDSLFRRINIKTTPSDPGLPTTFSKNLDLKNTPGFGSQNRPFFDPQKGPQKYPPKTSYFLTPFLTYFLTPILDTFFDTFFWSFFTPSF